MTLGQMKRPWVADTGPEPLSPRALHLLLAGHAASVPDDLRRARRRADLHAAAAIQHAAPGADAARTTRPSSRSPGAWPRASWPSGPAPRPTASGSSMRSCSAWADRPSDRELEDARERARRSDGARSRAERTGSPGVGAPVARVLLEPRRIRDARVMNRDEFVGE